MDEEWLSALEWMRRFQPTRTMNRPLVGRLAQAARRIMVKSGQEPVIRTVQIGGAKKGITRDVTTYPKNVLDQAFREVCP